MKSSKEAATKANATLRLAVSQLEEDLLTANTKLQVCKQTNAVPTKHKLLNLERNVRLLSMIILLENGELFSFCSASQLSWIA